MTRRKRQHGASPTKNVRQGVRSTEDGRWEGVSNARSPVTTAARLMTAKDWLFAAALMVAVFLVYQPAWQGGFIWDDAST